MSIRLLVGTVAVYLLTGCASQPEAPASAVPQCQFVVASEVDGVTVVSTAGPRGLSVAGKKLQFTLPCGSQVFSLTKPCYALQQVTLQPAPEGGLRLARDAWEHHGYLRVENGSASEPLVVGGLPDGDLHVRAHSHSPRRVPVGNYRVSIEAPFKVPVEHEFTLCGENEIFNLRVGTEGHDGELIAQGSQDVVLEHGLGSLRVLTEEENVKFTIEPEMGQALQSLLDKLGLEKFFQLSIDEVPEPLRKGLKLLQELNSGAFRAPAVLELPAGRYFVEHSLQSQEENALALDVPHGEELKIVLQKNQGDSIVR